MNLGFKLDEQEIRQQVDNYQTLSIFKSYRGISALLLWFSVLVTVVMLVTGVVTKEAWLDIVLLGVVSYFVYRGNAVAFLVAIGLWTLEKGYMAATQPSAAVIQLIWWYIYVQVFYKGYLVEKARVKTAAVPMVTETQAPPVTPPTPPPPSPNDQGTMNKEQS
jgi:hypothetical protein